MNKDMINNLVAERLIRHDAALLEKIRSSQWTSHNIPVTLSQSTKPGGPLIEDDARVKAIKKNLYIFFRRDSGLSGLRLLDLGCLEGGISFEMAREGMDVLGVEGREDNYLKCRLVEDYFLLPNLEFIYGDVKALDRAANGVFDVVLCLGLLYHLDEPVVFLEKLFDMTHEKGLLFLDTHVAPERLNDADECKFRESLSDVVKVNYKDSIYEGRWFREYDEEKNGTTEAWAAVSNYRSFWPTEISLMKALYRIGFKNIYKLYGCLDIDHEFRLRKKFSRLWLIALKDSFWAASENCPIV